MGIFNFLKKKTDQHPDLNEKPLDISHPLEPVRTGQEFNLAQQGASIDAIYAFLQFDYESRGFNDALTNPDDSYRNDNVNLLKQDLFILIEKSITFYEGLQKEVDFHINSRTRAGLIDLVEELKTRREMVTDHLAKIKIIKEDALNGNGAVQRIALSYQRGFMRGLSALTQSNVFNKKL